MTQDQFKRANQKRKAESEQRLAEAHSYLCHVLNRDPSVRELSEQAEAGRSQASRFLTKISAAKKKEAIARGATVFSIVGMAVIASVIALMSEHL